MVPRRIGLLLVDGFALMSFASAMEPLRAANVIAGRELYAWRHIAVGEVALASSGLRLAPDHRVCDAVDLDMLLVVAGGNRAEFRDTRTLRSLRRLARSGTRIGGVSGGPFVLARAGLLDGYRCTTHWEHVPAFQETFPQLEMRRRLYEVDRDRLTCARGVAALNMMHALISQDHGRALADAVAEWFLQAEIRAAGGAQRRSLQERFRVGADRPRGSKWPEAKWLLPSTTMAQADIAGPYLTDRTNSIGCARVRPVVRLSGFRDPARTSYTRHQLGPKIAAAPAVGPVLS